jgi:hypothetical protein
MTSRASTENWLQEFMSDAVRSPLCTRIGCTTCGAYEFRSELRARVAGSARSSGTPSIANRVGLLLDRMSENHVELLLDLMSELKPPEHDSFAWEGAMRLMIFDCWIDLGGDRALPFMQDRLGQSWAGRVLGRMIAHEEARRRARQEHEARSEDPVRAQERRVQRKHERQLRHERRLFQKKERDKLWRANAASSIRSET